MNPFSLEGKTIFVTGASSGIGRAVAVMCSQMGARLIITGRNANRLSDTFALLEEDNHIQTLADLNNSDDLNKLVLELPKIDGFVCNAGIARPIVLQQAEESDVNDVVSINALVPINLTRLLIQNKNLNKNASVVFMSSINGNQCSSVGNSIYAATKSALTGFMKGVALELAHRKIRVNCINPGMIETDIYTGTAIGTDELEADKRKYPLGRYGKPEEVAYAVVYLLSDAAHDSNVKPISEPIKKQMIQELAKHYRVLLFHENTKVDEFYKPYLLSIKPEELHHIIAYAAFCLTEGATMASESGLLGIPYIYINPLQVGYVVEQMKLQPDLASSCSVETMIMGVLQEKLKSLKEGNFQKERKVITDNIINPTKLLVWFVENYPASKHIMQENPEYQYNFK